MSRTYIRSIHPANTSVVIPIEKAITKKHKPVKSSHYPKHIRNAHSLEKQRRRDLIYNCVLSWMPNDSAKESLTHRLLKEYFNAIKSLIKLMGYRYKKNLLLPTVIYMDKFIQKNGTIPPAELFHLLLISAVVTVKFWEDYGIDPALLEEVSGIPRKKISDMERNFLCTIDYSLFLSNNEVEAFQNSVKVL